MAFNTNRKVSEEDIQKMEGFIKDILSLEDFEVIEACDTCDDCCGELAEDVPKATELSVEGKLGVALNNTLDDLIAGHIAFENANELLQTIAAVRDYRAIVGTSD